jgi:ParB family chromosome partitioning protein
VLPVVMQSYTDREMITLTVTENIQREDLTPLEEGKLFQKMVDDMEFMQAQIAKAVNEDRNYISRRLQLVNAPLVLLC